MISKYMKQRWTSYYRANLFFPKGWREQIYLLYAFVRVPDNIVDDPTMSRDAARGKLETMRDVCQAVYEWSAEVTESIADQAVVMLRDAGVPWEWIENFFDAMLADTRVDHYETYEQLQWYMHGSAEVIGMMMCKLFDAPEESYVYAAKLGEAMQYTNFLRDVAEDRHEHKRVYMPTDRLMPHNLNHTLVRQMCETGEMKGAWEAFMAQEIVWSKELYREAAIGIGMLPKQARLAVYLASELYEGILQRIYRNGYDVFGCSARTTKRDKLWLLVRGLSRYVLGKTPW